MPKLKSDEFDDDLCYAIKRIGDAVTPNINGNDGPNGVHVSCLTEAVMDVGAGLKAIAEAIDGLASAIRGHE